MTFDEWWHANEKQYTSDSCHMSEYHMASVVFNASRDLAIEECAQVADKWVARVGNEIRKLKMKTAPKGG